MFFLPRGPQVDVIAGWYGKAATAWSIIQGVLSGERLSLGANVRGLMSGGHLSSGGDCLGPIFRGRMSGHHQKWKVGS